MIDNLTNRSKLVTNHQLPIYAIVPCFNEAAIIQQFISALLKQLQQLTKQFIVIIVDDGSYDNTIEQLLTIKQTADWQNHLNIIQLSRNFGKETALLAGIEYVLNHGNQKSPGSFIAITIDADFQHPLELIPEMVTCWTQGFDMVYGIRAQRQDQSWLQRLSAAWFYHLMHRISKTNIIPHAGDFRLLDRKIMQALAACKEKHRFTKGLYAWVGFKSRGIEFQATKRSSGTSHFGIKNSLKLALNGIISFSNIPLRIWGLLGLWISAASFSYGLYLLIKLAIYGIDVPGYLSLMLAIMFFGGVQLLSIGILGEYVARIFDETKQRPSYIVKDIIE